MITKSKKQIKKEAREKKAAEQFEKDTAHLYANPVCANCHKDITKYRVKKAKKEKWLPLCPECDIFLREQMEKCLPLLKTVFGGKN